jgi:tRNA(fMet)-specific endonuclease VapC
MVLWGNLVGQLEQNGRPLPAMDSLIAAMPTASEAIALQHSLSLVTRNEKDFAGTGVVIINPWS